MLAAARDALVIALAAGLATWLVRGLERGLGGGLEASSAAAPFCGSGAEPGASALGSVRVLLITLLITPALGFAVVGFHAPGKRARHLLLVALFLLVGLSSWQHFLAERSPAGGNAQLAVLGYGLVLLGQMLVGLALASLLHWLRARLGGRSDTHAPPTSRSRSSE